VKLTLITTRKLFISVEQTSTQVYKIVNANYNFDVNH